MAKDCDAAGERQLLGGGRPHPACLRGDAGTAGRVHVRQTVWTYRSRHVPFAHGAAAEGGVGVRADELNVACLRVREGEREVGVVRVPLSCRCGRDWRIARHVETAKLSITTT
jgi:hypothetical protein